MNLSYFPNSYFYNYKLSPRILHQHRVLLNFRKNKDFIKKKSNKENGVVISDQNLCKNATQETISDTSKFEKFNEDLTLKRGASFYVSRNKKNF